MPQVQQFTHHEILERLDQLRQPGAHRTLIIESYNGKIIQVEMSVRERKIKHAEKN